ncbi:MAG: arginine--tRNA ligase [Metamycoplasmataceae bacterium]
MNNLIFETVFQKNLDDYLSKIKQTNISYSISIPKNNEYGDYSTNLALLLSKILNKNAIEIAQEIEKELSLNKYINKIEIIKPGFINVFIDDIYYDEFIKNINILKNDYGNNISNLKVNLEFVSANPTGFLHVAHARGAALGDSLANILETQGIKVLREYYINDAGSQINNLALSIYIRYMEIFNKEIPSYSLDNPDLYKGNDIIWITKKIINKIKDKWVNSDYNEIVEEVKKEGVLFALNKIKEDLKSLGVLFDLFSSEKELYEKDLILPTLKNIKNVFVEDGATWLETKSLGDDKNRVLIKKDGTYTYFLPDIVYHNIKLSREPKVDKLINIWGADHSGYIKRVQAALTLSGYKEDVLDVITIQLVRLIKNNVEVKMSKRKGTSLYLSELVEQVGKDTARFFLVNRSSNSQIDFDMDLAILKTNDNPVFNIQYAHARCYQLLEKANFSYNSSYKNTNFNFKKEKSLIKIIEHFPKLLNQISKNYKVHLLSQYLIDLTKEFNSYYSNNKIIGSENETQLLLIVNATKIVLSKGLTLLGVSSPNKM